MNPDDENEYFEQQTLIIDLMKNSTLNEHEACTALLALFFGAKLNQSTLKLIIKFTEFLTNLQLPQSFDSLVNRVMGSKNRNNEYEKNWLCVQCGRIHLKNSFQRRCNDCQRR